ncbi:MAG: SufBD protein [Firmicutes bacterium]|nr:SufBD protein [Bacillota bacterium]
MIHLINTLWSKNSSEGYDALKKLLDISGNSNSVYFYMDEFIEKLENGNSYFRTRALSLIAANAKWDTSGKIDKNINRILSHITDTKPITARNFIKILPNLAEQKPKLKPDILQALLNADTAGYSASMRPLVEADIKNAVNSINDL